MLRAHFPAFDVPPEKEAVLLFGKNVSFVSRFRRVLLSGQFSVATPRAAGKQGESQ